MRAAVAQAPVEKLWSGDAGVGHGGHGQHVGEGDEGRGGEHGYGVAARRVLDLLRDS